MSKKVTLIDSISMVILLLAPILWIYGNPGGWNYETILTLPLSVFYFFYYFFKNKDVIGKKNILCDGLLVYFIYWIFIFVITSMKLPLPMIQVYLAFFLFFATFHRDVFIKMYKLFALLCIVFFLIQEMSYQATGVRITGLLSSLPLHSSLEMSDFIEIQASLNRSSSFFGEPAHFAQFLLPLLAIEIYLDKSKYSIVFAIVIALTLLFLRSGNGLLGLATTLIFLIPFYWNNKKWQKKLYLFPIILFIGLVGYYYVSSDMGNELLERQSELGMSYEGGSRSGFLRIWRGFYVYDNYSISEKIFGCPDDIAQLAHVYSSGMIMNVGAELYFNAFQKILLNTGLVGVAIFYFIVYKIWKNNTVCGKAIIFTLIGLSFISAIYMTHTMILFLVLAESMKGKDFGNNMLSKEHAANKSQR